MTDQDRKWLKAAQEQLHAAVSDIRTLKASAKTTKRAGDLLAADFALENVRLAAHSIQKATGVAALATSHALVRGHNADKPQSKGAR